MRKTILRVVAAVVVVAVVATVGYVAYQQFLGPKTVTAYFRTTTAIYNGDDVRVSGMKVGTIESIKPEGTRSKITMKVDRDVSIPADASAVIVAQSLIAARFVQLTPAYHDGGPRMKDNAVIPESKTAVPVEWDEIKDQLSRLADTVGPNADDVSGSLATFIDSAGNAFSGNGDKLRNTLRELSASAKILSDKSSDIFGTVKNLQVFVSALKNSTAQLSEFQNQFATLTSTIDGSRTDLDSALKNLSVAVVDVQRFVRDNRNGISEQVQRLGDATQVLVDKRSDLEQVLHVAPTGLQNYNNIYNPDQGTVAGAFVFNNFSSPANFICSAIQSLQNATAEQGAKLCADYLGPVLNTLSFNYPAFPINPSLGPSAKPENLIYSEPSLRPGGSKAAPQTQAAAPKSISDLLAPARSPR